ncbi:DNA/RNA helicase, superfamily I [Haloferax elongans ATCC BAA-1513]|uniref:DNA 3'-5' helicase n=1 Tax=Haloferax elongans ATCC BAA-1513 TaxID=1230453 RepID=M0HH70_HALEO|nr:ATP-dependent helicase [Haloferax elongans]ELZ83138.1 DNA/RNA helicase, superfamily I [Haloferax elongans ATCC BAA-1513]
MGFRSFIANIFGSDTQSGATDSGTGADIGDEHSRSTSQEEPVSHPGPVRYDDEERANRLLEKHHDLFFVEEEDGRYELNPRQKEAIVKLGTHNQIVAGAGTGKTFSLTYRAKFLVEEGVKPHDIIALTFTKDAAEVMGQRLAGEPEERLFDEPVSIDTRTLHSLGSNILRKKYDFELLVEQRQHTLVADILSEFWEQDPEFRDRFHAFRAAYQQERFAPDKPNVITGYFYSQLPKSSSLAGDAISQFPFAERIAHETIADFLFEHGVRYRKDKLASVTKTDNLPYFRLFELPQYDLTVEYVLPARLRDEKPIYKRRPGASELRRLHSGTDHDVLIIEHDELFDTDRVNKQTLKRTLRRELRNHGVSLDADGFEFDVPEISDWHTSRDVKQEHWRVYCYNVLWTDIVDQFVDFISRTKENQKDPRDELRRASEDEYLSMVWDFSHCAVEVYEEYVSRLDRDDLFDFSDLIIEATDLLHNPPESVDLSEFEYEHVMVDEFQDLNLSQLELVQALLDTNDESCLFAIGDDWQSIYGFKAAKPEFFIDFHKHFTPATQTELVTNYRCDETIVEAGNTLISNNEDQIDKSVDAHSNDSGEIYVHTVPFSDEYEQQTLEKIIELVEDSPYLHPTGDGKRGGDIMVLARTRTGSPSIQKIRKELRDRDIVVGDHSEPMAVSVDTGHSSKGEEAAHVIVTNAIEDTGGFPTSDQVSLQSLVESRPTGDEFIEEERRLFYVAVTRAESRLDIQTSDEAPSRFINEIREFAQFDERGNPADIESLRAYEGERITASITVSDQFTDAVGKAKIDAISRDSLQHLVGTSVKYVQFTELSPKPGDELELTNALVDEYQGSIQLKVDNTASISRQ